MWRHYAVTRTGVVHLVLVEVRCSNESALILTALHSKEQSQWSVVLCRGLVLRVGWCALLSYI